MEHNQTKVEYVWLDGYKPTAGLRSKTKILTGPVTKLGDIPEWGFDGSSTEQAEGKFSDCRLKPVFLIPDPIRGTPHMIVLCEVFTADNKVHPSNTRAALRVADELYKKEEAWFGIEQEYTMFADGRPYGFPVEGFPAPQGPYYCGVGAENIVGRDLAEEHLSVCLEAGLTFSGINAEVGVPGGAAFATRSRGSSLDGALDFAIARRRIWHFNFFCTKAC
jgi:glutamine synthetase